MKTAISIPDNLYLRAEELAARLGTSRSQLYAQALKQYVADEQDTLITEKLNEVYSQQSSKLDSGIIAAQHKVLTRDREEW